MTPERLAHLMMYEWRECDPVIPPWDEYSEKAKADAMQVAARILDRIAKEEQKPVENYTTTLKWTENNGTEHTFQSKSENEVYTKGNELLADYLLCKIRNYSIEAPNS